MIEGTLAIFEEDYTFKIVAKTSTDSFYGKNTLAYTTITAKAVITPHTTSFQQTDQPVGVSPSGLIDIYVRSLNLKKDDIVLYESKEYKITEESRWDCVLGEFNVYTASI